MRREVMRTINADHARQYADARERFGDRIKMTRLGSEPPVVIVWEVLS